MHPPEPTPSNHAAASGGAAVPHRARGFEFQRDTFAFANETRWRYAVDPATGRQVATPRVPVPDYMLHCFVVVRAARQFWLHARFEPTQPAPDEATCRGLIRAVVARSAQTASGAGAKVVIPGYASLREFSVAREALLKAGCGGAWRSYFQRGNWRMIYPFWRSHQASEAARLTTTLRDGGLPIVHVQRFPQLTINHTLLLFGAQETSAGIEFRAYDPNVPEREIVLTFERATRTFTLPPLPYFAGGRVDVYEIYRGWIY
ncbi:hypothetical protein LBMAG56_10580 [Verrucomicrobiota bacterium]|nr:hypothetical protein LBMAG56_10580 [Verrucomicrobiota bacterium]